MAPDDPAHLEQRLTRLEGLVDELLRRIPEPAAAIAAEPPVAAPASTVDALFAAPRPIGLDPEADRDHAPSPEAEPRIDATRSVGGQPLRGTEGPGSDAGRGSTRRDESRRTGDDRPRKAAPVRARFDGRVWLNGIGILLVLVSMAMLFRYSIDRGWLTPLVRVAFGAATGLALLGAGFWLDVRSQRFVSVLYGGGMAIFYIVGFAAFYVYELVGYAPAFVGMCGVTVLTFALAVWKDEQALAVLAAVGGLGIPLVLGIDHGQPHTFAVYTCFILAWTAALYLRRGWRTLHWLSALGAWSLLVAYATLFHNGPADVFARWALEGAAVFAWLATSLLPFAQEIARGDPALRASATPAASAADEDGDEPVVPGWRDVDLLHWHGVALLPALLALLVTSLTWSPGVHAWGAIALGAAALYGAAALLVRDRHEPGSVVLSTAASVLLAVGTVAAFDGEALLLVLAAEALALQVLARRSASRLLSVFGHVLYAFAWWWMVARLVLPSAHETGPAAANLAVIATALVISFVLESRTLPVVYRVFAHLALLGWLWSTLWPFSEGFVTISWGIYGLGLLLYAMRAGLEKMERLGIGTLLLVVAKLFLVDLARMDALWRVLLFLGMGMVFLFLSYALQNRLRPTTGAPEPEADGG